MLHTKFQVFQPRGSERRASGELKQKTKNKQKKQKKKTRGP